MTNTNELTAKLKVMAKTRLAVGVRVMGVRCSDLVALTEALEAAEKRNARQQEVITNQDKWINDIETTMISAVDRAEAAEKRVSELEKLAEAESVGADKMADSGVEWMKRCLAAEKRIAELEARERHSERQSVIDGLAASGETWEEIQEYMKSWEAARAAGIKLQIEGE